MAKLTIGEIADPDSRFPQIYLQIGFERYRLSGPDASRLGQAIAEAARRSVSRVDIDVLRPVVFQIEVTPL